MFIISVVILLSCNICLTKAQSFRSYWHGGIETFVTDSEPELFQTGNDAILSVRQLHFEGIEWAPLMYVPQSICDLFFVI